MPVNREKLREWGKMLRKSRRWQGLTCEELAKVLNVNPVTVMKWEHGKHVPHFRVANQIVTIAQAGLTESEAIRFRELTEAIISGE